MKKALNIFKKNRAYVYDPAHVYRGWSDMGYVFALLATTAIATILFVQKVIEQIYK